MSSFVKQKQKNPCGNVSLRFIVSDNDGKNIEDAHEIVSEDLDHGLSEE